jgi:hypothetical protein
LALQAEEGRGWLRKASGSCQRAMIRGYPNGETQLGKPKLPYAEYIGVEGVSRGTETSKYPEEKRVFPE